MDNLIYLYENDKMELMNILECDNTGNILEILSEENMLKLKKYRYRSEILQYIITYSKYKNDILNNNEIIDIVFKELNNYYAVLSMLDYDTSMNLFNKSIIEGINTAKLFSYLNKDNKIKILENWNYPNELLYDIFEYSDLFIKQKIIDTFNFDLSKVNLKYLFSKDKTKLSIPGFMITRSVAEKICGYNDIFIIRRMLNNAIYMTDTTKLNEYVKNIEENIIINANNDTLIEPYNTIFKLYSLLHGNRIVNENTHDYEEILRKTYSDFIEKTNMYDVSFKIYDIVRKDGIEGVYKYLKLLSDRSLSNYVVDYLFEENYHNIILDINELLRFYFDGNINIPLDRVTIYEKISNIDSLTTEEKKELFKEIKSINIMELFYDDMLNARQIVGQSIKDSSITISTLSEYKDEVLSNKYGVDIYNGENKDFYAIVKTGTGYSFDQMPTGHSFSLVSNNNTRIFSNDNITLLYDASSFNPEQLVHTYPTDSFTLYQPYKSTKNPTTRVNNLLTSEELINMGLNSYNELLILEQGTNETEMDNRISKLKPIAIYCEDEIDQKSLSYAKNSGLGIFLAKRKKLENTATINEYRGDIDYWHYNYYDETEKDVFENRRIK